MKSRIGWNGCWVAVGLALASLPAVSATIDCTVAPAFSIVTEGESVQLSAVCTGGTGGSPVSTVNWKMNGVSVTGDVDVSTYGVGKAINYTTPVSVGINSEIQDFTVVVTPVLNSGDTVSAINAARVVVKPSSAAVAAASSLPDPTTPKIAECGSANLTATSLMPSGTSQCKAGSKPAIAVSGPDAFTWSCLSLTGGAEANCYALRGFNVLAVEGTNPGEGAITSLHPQAVAKGATGTVSVNMTNVSFSPTFVSPCGGTQTGNNFTTGPVTTGDCTVTVNYTNTPINGLCGTANTAFDVTGRTEQPDADLCSSGTYADVADTDLVWKWACNGNNIGGATNASCDAPKQYNVTATPAANGKVDNSSVAVVKAVKAGSTTSFSIVANTGYGISSVQGVGCTVTNTSGSTYTTSAISGICTISASFTPQVVSLTDPGVGKGLWVPTPANNTWIADQSGPNLGTSSYVPGCLNGIYPPSASSTGCGGQSSYTGVIFGTTTSTTFAFGSGNVLGLRYVSKPTAGTSIKSFLVGSGDGGNVGYSMKLWLSSSPTATYDATATNCKITSATQPYIITGPGYCSITPNTTYYLKLSVDTACPNCRFKIIEGSSDFN